MKRLLVACVPLLLFAVACNNSTNSGPLREPDEYTGCGTDEHWRTFDDQEPHVTVSDASSPQLTAPAPAIPIAFANKPIFAWNQDPADPGAPAGDVPHDGPGCTNCCPQWNTGELTTLHLPPISGNVYDLQFSTGGQVTHRVVTTLQEWMPSDALWTMWRGQTVSVRIFRMAVIANDIRPGVGGPFVATHPTTYTVGN
jgi:hypothetical protein